MPGDTAAIVLAAGRGRRMGGRNKAGLPLGGRPLLAHSLATLKHSPSVAQVIVVLNPADREALRRQWERDLPALGADLVVAGGKERWNSSRAGCRAADPALPILLVHDAARPLVEETTVEAVIAAAREQGAALAAVPLADTLKREDASGNVAATPDRTGLWRAQTPQAFRKELLLKAFEAWPAEGPLPTDEAILVEAFGTAPRLVAAPASNLKVTTPEDLQVAEALLQARRRRIST